MAVRLVGCGIGLVSIGTCRLMGGAELIGGSGIGPVFAALAGSRYLIFCRCSFWIGIVTVRSIV